MGTHFPETPLTSLLQHQVNQRCQKTHAVCHPPHAQWAPLLMPQSSAISVLKPARSCRRCVATCEHGWQDGAGTLGEPCVPEELGPTWYMAPGILRPFLSAERAQGGLGSEELQPVLAVLDLAAAAWLGHLGVAPASHGTGPSIHFLRCQLFSYQKKNVPLRTSKEHCHE